MGFFSVTFVAHCQFISHSKAKARHHHMRVTDVGLHHHLAKARNSRWPSDCATCTLASNWPHHSLGHDVIGTPPGLAHDTLPSSREARREGEKEKEKKKGKKKKRAIPVVKYFLCYGLPQDTSPPPHPSHTIHLTLHLFLLQQHHTTHHTPLPLYQVTITSTISSSVSTHFNANLLFYCCSITLSNSYLPSQQPQCLNLTTLRQRRRLLRSLTVRLV